MPPLAKGHLREITTVAPSKFAHVVFNTHRYDEMIDWYAGVFEARVQHRDDRLAFLTYDDEHHRFAFVNLGPAKDGPEKPRAMAPGLNHLAYTWRNLEELIDTYTRLKNRGVMPTRPIRHGPTLSLYYRDPDGNGLEFQIDLMETKDANEFMKGAASPPIRSASLSTRKLWRRGLCMASQSTQAVGQTSFAFMAASCLGQQDRRISPVIVAAMATRTGT